MPYAKFHGDSCIRIWNNAKLNIHQIWIITEKWLVKWAPDFQHIACSMFESQPYAMKSDISKVFLQEISREQSSNDYHMIVIGIVIILWMHPANEWWRYIVTSSLIGWAHSQNDPFMQTRVDFLSYYDNVGKSNLIPICLLKIWNVIG